MAHFAELDSNDTVLRVIVVGNPDCLDSYGEESEEVGILFCQSLFGAETRWAQTSYNGNKRGRLAQIGDWFDRVNDMFVTPDPGPIES